MPTHLHSAQRETLHKLTREAAALKGNCSPDRRLGRVHQLSPTPALLGGLLWTGFSYDAASRLETVTDWDSLTTTYVYDKAGRLGTVTLPNGIVSSYEYDDAGRLLSLTHEDDPITFASCGYTYDDVGNRLTADEAVRQPDESSISVEITYEYDPLHRLTAADYNDQTYFHYTYDAVGNRLTETTESGLTTYEYDIARAASRAEGEGQPPDRCGRCRAHLGRQREPARRRCLRIRI